MNVDDVVAWSLSNDPLPVVVTRSRLDRAAALAMMVVILLMFALLAYTAGVAHRVVVQRDDARVQRDDARGHVARLSEMCGSRPDGSGECKPGAFLVPAK